MSRNMNYARRGEMSFELGTISEEGVKPLSQNPNQ